jgi:hypothetical protein
MSESAEQQWYFARNGQQQGPLPESTLRQMLASGQLSPSDAVWRQGMPQWVAAGSIPALMAAPSAPGMPPPAPYPPAGYPPQAVLPVGYAGPQTGYRPYGAPPSDIGQDPGVRWLLPVGRSGWAIAAGYLGLLSVIPIFAPIALIISIVAIRDIKKHPQRHGMGRAIFGLVMGILFSIGFCVMMVALLAGH